jgi:hypothetical protein
MFIPAPAYHHVCFQAYTLEGNIVAREPLTPIMHLLQLDGRMDAHLELLARALAGYRVALRLLSQRMAVMAGTEHASSLRSLVHTLMHRDAVDGMLKALLDAAALDPSARSRAASMAARASAAGGDAANAAAAKSKPDCPLDTVPIPAVEPHVH